MVGWPTQTGTWQTASYIVTLNRRSNRYVKSIHLQVSLGSPNDLPILKVLCYRDRDAVLCREGRHQKRQTCDVRCNATSLTFGWVGFSLDLFSAQLITSALH